MNHYLNPIDVVEKPRETLIRYLLTAYPLRDPHLRQALKTELEQPGTIWQHPYVEGSQPYLATKSVTELVQAGTLHPLAERLFQPSARPLYHHQVEAVETVVQQGENIVVATGTGSGKTECFLIPMTDMLLKEESQLAHAGVRALLLYPMNALVNDQVKRLRQLLCQQDLEGPGPHIRFGFYTSRTPKELEGAKGALEALRKEYRAYSTANLLKLFSERERIRLDGNDRESLIDAAVEKTRRIQVLSRQEIWEQPPHILVTNYSMLEHMLMRPKERAQVFEASRDTMRLLVIDEAHSYNGATGTEVSMLINRFKSAVQRTEVGQLRCIATSASLGDQSVDNQVLGFASQLFGEPFSRVIRGKRITSSERLGAPAAMPEELSGLPSYEVLSLITLPERTASLSDWREQLAFMAPISTLDHAEGLAAQIPQAESRLGAFLWHALKRHPLIHRLIDQLAQAPRPWHQITRSQELWGEALPRTVEGETDADAVEAASLALANLIQLGTLAKETPDGLPLVPVRVHLLFRSFEGVYACLNPDCAGRTELPDHLARGKNRFGKLYLSSRACCDVCSGPVLELASCRKCGQAYNLGELANESGQFGEVRPVPRFSSGQPRATAFLHLTAGPIDGATEDDDVSEGPEEEASSGPAVFHFERTEDGWKGRGAKGETSQGTEHKVSDDHYALCWHLPPEKTETGDGFLSKCPGCGAGRSRVPPIRSFVANTDAPLEVLLDSLFELLPDPDPRWRSLRPTMRRMLAFSDGRQDAAFFASDFQRTHTEALYRQFVWHAFQTAQTDSRASVKSVESQLAEFFQDISIPHPDRLAEEHHKSYVEVDKFDADGGKRKNALDCEMKARKRAKELVLREFGLPSSRRFSLEALGLLACHVPLRDTRLFDLVGERFGLSPVEAQLFLSGLLDVIRLSGAVDLQGASMYFPETGGDGKRPGMLDGTGRSRKYIRFKKDAKEDDAFSFVCRRKKSGEPTARQNHFVDYIKSFIGRLPEDSETNFLFTLLADEEYLTPHRSGGRQLNWNLLTLEQNRSDWFECESCRQLFHRPGLEAAWEAVREGARQCLAYRCTGKLSPHLLPTSEKELDHYRHLITQRQVFPLRAQEHTAQLGVVELEQRENRFVDGFVNLLSCSTTLEMGVDIGELQAVALRNFPPHVSNYQQRAGRAGRRADGVAVTLMYGQRRPHDRYYFERPELLIAGQNHVPKLTTDNEQIQQRHIRAELLADFLRPFDKGAEHISLAGFYDLPDPDDLRVADPFVPPGHAMAYELIEWLSGDKALKLTREWLTRLSSTNTAESLLEAFRNALSGFQEAQLKDWNGLVSLWGEMRQALIEDPEDERARNKLKGIKSELKKVRARKLHGELAQACILPIYGFPIDVVRLLTGESDAFSAAQSRHRLERDRRLALGEYAPGQQIVVDDRVHRSVGIVRPASLERSYYWVCRSCNFFYKSKQEDAPPVCPVCKSEDFPEDGRSFKVPQAFTTNWSEPPEVTPHQKPRRQPVSQVFLAQDGSHPVVYDQRPDCYTLTISQGGSFFLANKGPKLMASRGFPLCRLCGLDLNDKVAAAPKRKKGESTPQNTNRYQHTHPITGRPCDASPDYIHLGHEFRSDLIKIRFAPRTKPTPLFGKVVNFGDESTIASHEVDGTEEGTGKGFWYSLTYGLLAAAAQVIDVPRAELDGLFVPTEGTDGLAEIVLYDNVPGGAGYSKRIAEQFDQILARTYQLVTSCDCERSCYDCLRTYANQIFHEELDRRLVEGYLQGLVDQVSPDEELQAFAPNAARVPLTRMAGRLRGLMRVAGHASVVYLPSLEDSFLLDEGAPLPWFKLVSDAVYALRRAGSSLVLALHTLPERSTVEGRYLRKWLWQWLDQGLIQLYVSPHLQAPTLCLSSSQPSPVAMQLRVKDNGLANDWLETRSTLGVQAVLDKLGLHITQGRAVKADELVDPATWIVWPSKAWADLPIEEFREALGLKRCFEGAAIKRITYYDRYLWQDYRAELLADLLAGATFAEGAEVMVNALEKRDSPPARTILDDLKKGLKGLEKLGLSPKVRVQAMSERRDFPHKRHLLIEMVDGQRITILFDKGLDFARVVTNAQGAKLFRVYDDTYVVVSLEALTVKK